MPEEFLRSWQILRIELAECGHPNRPFCVEPECQRKANIPATAGDKGVQLFINIPPVWQGRKQ